MTAAGERAHSLRTEARTRVYAYERDHPAELSQDALLMFRKRAEAWTHFERCPPSYRTVMLHWVTTARKPETRAQRLQTPVDASGAGKRLK